MFKNKKANWPDILEYSKGIIILGISIIITFILLNQFNNTIITNATNNTLLNDTNALDKMQETVTNFPNITDWIIPLLYIIFVGFSAWSASKIPTSHKFIFIGVIMLIIILAFSLFIEIVWQEFTTNTTISTYINNFPLTNFFISYLRYFVLFYGLIVGVALYAKTE